MTMPYHDFIHHLRWQDVPLSTQNMTRRCLLDLLEAQYCAEVSEEELLTGLVIGYEVVCHAGASLHDSVCGSHTSAALIHKQITVQEIEGAGLRDEAVHALSKSIKLYEVEAFNNVFPERRISEVSITLKDGRQLASGPTEANGDPEIPLSEAEIDDKFHHFATPVLGTERTTALHQHVRNMGNAPNLQAFNHLIYPAGVQS